MCYHYEQEVHVMAQCPLFVSRLVQALATSILRTTDRRHGRVEPPRARVRAFQLTTEEARAAPDVVTGMFLFIIMSIYVFVCL